MTFTKMPKPSTNRRLWSPFLLSLLLILLLSPSHARSWSSNQLPSPQNDPGGICSRKVKSTVCDPDGYLSQSDADQIQGLANFINEGSHGFKKLPCPGGSSGPQIAVAIVSSMSGLSGNKQNRAFQFAKDLHDRWGVGDPNCQNGIVLFFSVNDHAMGFSTGAGIKTVFTDSMVPIVMENIAPLLREGQYGPAIIQAVTAIGNVLSGGKPPSSGYLEFKVLGVVLLFWAAICMCVCCSAISVNSGPSRYEQSKKALLKIDKNRERASANEIVATSCPICLEDFEAPLPASNGSTSGTANTTVPNADVDQATLEQLLPASVPQDNTRASSAEPLQETADVQSSRPEGSEDALPASDGSTSATATITVPSANVDQATLVEILPTSAPQDNMRVSSAEPLQETADVESTPLLNGSTTTHTAGTGETNATSLSQDASTSESRTRILACGHKFHESCITSWLTGPNQSNEICPICRQPVQSTSEREVEERTNRGAPSGWDVYDEEYRFRMRRAHYYYPDYVSGTMINDWEGDRYLQHRPMATSSAFTAVDPAVVAEAARQSGGGGSSFSFGGGSSAGGSGFGGGGGGGYGGGGGGGGSSAGGGGGGGGW